jgi:MATE family multidrug resistance protein
MVLSTGSWSFQQFVERVFLTWRSPESVAAAMPAGLVCFVFMSLFLGTVTYANTFVAQYTGAGRPERAGASVWQAIHLAALSGVLMLGLVPLAGAIFDWAGHDPKVRPLEVAYFQLLCYGAAPHLVASAASTLFTGLGRTRVVMWVNLGCVAVLNTLLSYAWIFGRWGLPALDIRGAGWASFVVSVAEAVAFLALMFRRSYRETYQTLRAWRPDPALLRRLVRFGLPNGVQFSLDIAAFSTFLLLVGRLGTTALAATNIAFNVNSIAFMPMIGLGIAVSTLVGQRLGQDRPDLAERSARSAAHAAFTYMGVVAAGYALLPGLFLRPFASGADPATFAEVERTAAVLLRFVALYCMFDAMYFAYSSAIKGAGDTRFVLYVSLSLSWGIMAIPSYVSWRLGWGLYAIWTFATAYIMTGGAIFFLRFRGGKWKSMRVIEQKAGAEDVGITV